MFAVDYNQLCWSTPDGFELENIRLRVPQGSFFGLLGPQGCGKTALLRLTMGLLRPQAGTITVLGNDSVIGSRSVRRQCTYAPASLCVEAALDSRLRVREFLAGSMSLHARVDHSRIAELCHLFHLDMHEKLAHLDDPERKRLMLIMALLPEPALILLDEPSLYLTSPERQLLFEQLKALHENGSTVFFTTRSVIELCRYTTHCALMTGGSILCGGETAQLDILRSHRVTVSVREGADELAAVLGVRNYTLADDSISFFYTGEMDRLVKLLSQLEVLNLRIENPTLESAMAAWHIMGGNEHAQTV